MSDTIKLSGSAIGSALFKAVDSNDDGFIEEAEFLKIVRLLEDLFDSESIATPSWARINKTNTEKVSTDEFASWWEKVIHHELLDDCTLMAHVGAIRQASQGDLGKAHFYRY